MSTERESSKQLLTLFPAEWWLTCFHMSHGFLLLSRVKYAEVRRRKKFLFDNSVTTVQESSLL